MEELMQDAIICCDLAKVKRLVLEDVDIINRQFVKLVTVEHDPDYIDLKNEEVVTPLSMSILYSHFEIAEWLIIQGADVNIYVNGVGYFSDDEGFDNRMSLVTYICGRCCFNESRLRVLKLLLERVSINLNEGDRLCGSGPLHKACLCGNKEIVEMLLLHGLRVDVYNHVGYTPLMLTGDLDIMTMLIRNGADVNARDYGDFTVLMLCFSEPFPYCTEQRVRLLLSSGADPSVKHGTGITVYDLAKKRLGMFEYNHFIKMIEEECGGYSNKS